MRLLLSCIAIGFSRWSHTISRLLRRSDVLDIGLSVSPPRKLWRIVSVRRTGVFRLSLRSSFRLIVLVVRWGVDGDKSSDFLLLCSRRRQKNTKPPMRAAPSIVPSTAPAMTPPDAFFLEVNAAAGVDMPVTVCVTTFPLTVKVCMPVVGVGVKLEEDELDEAELDVEVGVVLVGALVELCSDVVLLLTVDVDNVDEGILTTDCVTVCEVVSVLVWEEDDDVLWKQSDGPRTLTRQTRKQD